ncbi:glutathione S-transferase omega-1-like isoform X2 [Anomaloglossus baeobatrachus]|uniref:glutathione S-transferase omega-1-like isoform X2 n=1 Tax=Anomaloglossus baeobatrachus TaxID=238106 RepID=UPI003F4F8DC4
MTTKKNEDTTELKAKIFEKFKIFEETLIKRNSPYIGGESVSMIDYMVWTWFERHQILDTTEAVPASPSSPAVSRTPNAVHLPADSPHHPGSLR